MITVKYNGTLGNNLWQYAVARIFAEERGLAFSAPSLKNFPQAAPKIKGKKYILPRFVFDNHFIDTSHKKGRFIFDGTFERFEYINGYQNELKKWFKPEVYKEQISGNNEIILSIRRGFNGWPANELCPSAKFYKELISKFKNRKFWICTDSPEDPFFNFLQEVEIEHEFFLGNPAAQFEFIRTAKTVIMAPSTFTFWATHVGNADKIYWPRIKALDFTNTKHDWFPSSDTRNEWI